MKVGKCQQLPSILIIDGINMPPIGKQIYDACLQIGLSVNYIDAKKLKQKRFYKSRKSIKKFLAKRKSKNEYCYCTKLSSSSVKFIEKAIVENQPDIVLVIGFSYPYVGKDFFANLKKQIKFKLVLFDTEFGNFISNQKKLKFYMAQELSRYDKLIVFSKKIAEFLEDKNAVFFPFGYKEIKSLKQTPKERDICFVGGPDMRRTFLLERLREQDLIVCGSSWRKYKDLISVELKNKVITENIWDDALYDLIGKSKIILNITNLPFYGLETGINLRVFEALAVGGFLLTDHYEELQDLFEIGKEIETFKSADELVDKVNFYLNHDDLRNKIAAKGHEKFLKHFTWESRVRDLIQIIPNSAVGREFRT
jgi:spore maturation protein CgeB